MKSRTVIGLMSGTSLDGLDIAFCRFEETDGKFEYSVEAAETLAYSPEWKQRLNDAFHASAPGLARLHNDYGHFLGKAVNDFIARHGLKPEFVSSHGHTVFHDPANGVTFQIGSGAAIAAECRLPVVCDFRALDVALGGQGAPLVPIGDKLLFSEYKYCLNLGGFANISYDHEGKRIAYDICPVNIAANAISGELGMDYDAGGEAGRKGQLNEALLNSLNDLAFYRTALHTPKSLGKEWVERMFVPKMESSSLSAEDRLRTLYEHIAIQVGRVAGEGNMLVSGGGAYNTFLIERIKHHSKADIVQAGRLITEFKEALIFAFLGLLRMEERANTLRDVTGASSDNIGGCIYLHR
jgi:anhydro-N-acetylmuramic acid kinase